MQKNNIPCLGCRYRVGFQNGNVGCSYFSIYGDKKNPAISDQSVILDNIEWVPMKIFEKNNICAAQDVNK